MKKTGPPGLRSEVGRYESAHDSSEPKFSRVLIRTSIYPTNPEMRPDPLPELRITHDTDFPAFAHAYAISAADLAPPRTVMYLLLEESTEDCPKSL